MSNRLAPPEGLTWTISCLEEEWRNALLAADDVALEALLHDRYVFVNPDGIVTGKGDDLKANRSGVFRLQRFEMRERIIQAHREVAIVCLLAELEGSFGGSAFRGLFRYTHTWHQVAGAWRIISGSITHVPEPIEP